MTVFTQHAQRKVDALPEATRPHIVPQILRAFDSPQITYGDTRNPEVEHRVHGEYAILVNRDSGKIITFYRHVERTETRGDEGKRRKLTYAERHRAALKGGRR